VAGSCEHSNEPLGSINSRELINQLSDHQLDATINVFIEAKLQVEVFRVLTPYSVVV
jgi:hypothetical protein